MPYDSWVLKQWLANNNQLEGYTETYQSNGEDHRKICAISNDQSWPSTGGTAAV